MRRIATLAWLLLVAGCGQELVCPSDQVACGGHCAALATDPASCGACGHACAADEACHAGTCARCASFCGAGRCVGRVCHADVEVACFTTDEVRGVTLALEAAGPPWAVDDGPISLAPSGGATWVAHALATTLLGLRPDLALPLRVVLGGSDLESVRPFGDLLAVSDSGAGTLVVVDPAAPAVVDEVSLAVKSGDFPNPLGAAFAGTRGYLALYGTASASPGPSFAEAQQIAVVDLSASATCQSPPCGTVVARIGLDVPPGPSTPGTYDPPGFPFPSRALAVEEPPGRFRVFVTLANLGEACHPDFGCFYTVPAGNGRLAVVDTAAGDALTAVDLGAGCLNPGGLAALGTTVWVACGGSGTILPVDVSGTTPSVGAALALPAPAGSFGFVPGNLAFCGGWGFVTDQFSGTIARFDPAGPAPVTTREVCPVDPIAGFAWAADVACGP
ncbi:MAG TPA: hypothetical protein VFI16_02310 [Anaeromyxobacteraceae bacterium]|nr:hypothetical protein [Anaeromyxobacteraceae bacterium]